MKINTRRLTSVGILCLGCVLLLLVAACGFRVFAVTSGSHASPEQGRTIAKRVVVWSNHATAGNRIITLAQQVGLVVVERARLQQIFDEQKIRLTHSPDDDAHILRVGKLIGADRVIFVEVSEKSSMFITKEVARTEFHIGVAVRGVDVETGEVRWSGSARLPRAVVNPEESAGSMAEAAVWRAICPLESGYQWKERTSEHEDAYCMKNGKQVDLIDHRSAILPLL